MSDDKYNRVKESFIDYAVSTHSSGDHRQIIGIHDDENEVLSIECILTDGMLTEVYFLNNQFYEQESEVLLQVVRDIVEGEYMVKSNFFKTKQWIVPKSLNGGPERTTKTAPGTYKMLPKPFRKI